MKQLCIKYFHKKPSASADNLNKNIYGQLFSNQQQQCYLALATIKFIYIIFKNVNNNLTTMQSAILALYLTYRVLNTLCLPSSMLMSVHHFCCSFVWLCLWLVCAVQFRIEICDNDVEILSDCFELWFKLFWETIWNVFYQSGFKLICYE